MHAKESRTVYVQATPIQGKKPIYFNVEARCSDGHTSQACADNTMRYLDLSNVMYVPNPFECCDLLVHHRS
jgi:hypothetical protein